MHRSLRLSLLLVVPAALALAADNKPPAMDDQQVASVKDAKWAPPKAPEIPAGVMVAPIAADPGAANIGYAKYPAGYVFPTHWHSAVENTTIISGKGRYTIAGKTYDLEAGSYIVIPAKAPHKFECLAGAECVAITRRPAPADYNWVK
jgi:quercetin dioxygenase-like cupin family protein